VFENLHSSCGLICIHLSWTSILAHDTFHFRSPPPTKKQKQSDSGASPTTLTNKELPTAQSQTPLAPKPSSDLLQPPSSPPNPRKRRASHSPKLDTLPPGATLPSDSTAKNVSIPSLLADGDGKKRGRTNTPWTAQEEQRLKQMRDAGNSWSEIAKVTSGLFLQYNETLLTHRQAFPARTEGSVKKHWYKVVLFFLFASRTFGC
jgi:hypothetical protein